MPQTKYETLLKILDGIRNEAVNTQWSKRYAVEETDLDAIQQARSRAFIHLYLKVMFGISTFLEREKYITDGSYDGGIDGYYIDEELKRIYLLQSKFRNNSKNFEEKKIDRDEILAMDIDRITAGYEVSDAGQTYNGKILGLIRNIRNIPDIARYAYKIVVIANCDIPLAQLRKLTDGHNAEVFDFQRSYKELVFPIVSGTYFKAQDVMIQLDLSHKSAGAKTSYSVGTPDYECEITVLFIPTFEIAKAMDKYRNTILEYNPRSYLDLDGQFVNGEIRKTLLKPNSNEFALMNNGITVLSDETNLNERIGQHNKAQLRLLRPQIINGGQTAYTLSRIYNEDKAAAETTFAGKEVLTKIITLTAKDPSIDSSAQRMALIDEISAASNRQTPVVRADKMSNEEIHKTLQNLMFDRLGIFYERKRGEFSDGIFAGYIDEMSVLERNFFIRLYFVAKGKLSKARKKRIFLTHGLSNEELIDPSMLDKVVDGYKLFAGLRPKKTKQSVDRQRALLAQIYLGICKTEVTSDIEHRLAEIRTMWNDIVEQVIPEPHVHFKERNRQINYWLDGPTVESDISKYLETGKVSRPQKFKVAQEVREEFEQLLSDYPPK
ncbi:AIPR family protein [Agrobacterium cavarae]|uniref:AIPR family protein n=1 Tax=Agrobacterium cavarae TaxID=2528239 RepID=UPI002FDA0F1B